MTTLEAGDRATSTEGDSREEALRRRLGRYSCAGTNIDGRLRDLDREWDTERAMEMHLAAIGLVGLLLTVTRAVSWVSLPAAALGLLLTHAARGRSLPPTLWRRLGFRSRREIDEERLALKLLRGDFKGVPVDTGAGERIEAILKAIRKEVARPPSRPSGVSDPRGGFGPRRRPLRPPAVPGRLESGAGESMRKRPIVGAPSDIRTENFLHETRARWSAGDDEEFERALRSIFSHLRWRLSPHEAVPLFAALPRTIGRLAREEKPHGYALGTPDKSGIDAEQFFAEIGRETHLNRGDVEQATSAVFHSMKHHLPEAQQRAMRSMLPKGLKRVWLDA